MHIRVNNIEIEIFEGARAKDAILKYYTVGGRKRPHRKLLIHDNLQNEISDDSPLREGSCIFVEDAPPKSRRSSLKCLLLLFLTVTTPAVVSARSIGNNGTTDGQKTNDGTKTVTILSVNDMHAAIENMPKFAATVDSLRTIYPQMLLFSAGDNRTGNPINDLYDETSYPMTTLMNKIGFDLSAVGNHEFDSKYDGLRNTINTSDFRYISANTEVPDSLRIHFSDCKFFERNGIRIGVLGLIQLGIAGMPDSHPDNVRKFRFSPAAQTARDYEWMRQHCDILIFLTHCGFEDDLKLADEFPYIDVIIGGHSHTKVEGTRLHNGVMITQAGSKLNYATLSQIHVKDGKVIGKEAQLIDIVNRTTEKPEIAAMIAEFSENETFHRALSQASAAFSSYEELGCLMTDAFRSEMNADIAIQNNGGVRFDTFPQGPITVMDVLRLDPFGNSMVEMNLNGEELKELLLSCRHGDEERIAYVSGMCYEITYDKKNPAKVHSIILLDENGKKLDMKRNYKVVANSYVAAIAKLPEGKPGADSGIKSSDLIMQYLQKQPSVNYKGISRVKETRK